MTTRFSSAGRTETGKVRYRNEDAILVREDLGMWVIADGMGGHSAGDYASALIVGRLGALRREGSVCDFIDAIEDSLRQVNTELREEAISRHVDVIGSTVVVLVHDRDFVLCGWVGDSRAYVHEDGAFVQLTSDHVCGRPGDVTQHGLPFGRSVCVSAGAGVLSRAVGAEDQLYIDWCVAGSRPGMHFLLCSDGINKELSDEELAPGHECPIEPDEALAQIFSLALDRPARDNLSAVIVRLDATSSAERYVASQRERRASQVLCALDEAYRLGRIARDEYRHRRRGLLESLREVGDTDLDTVRRAVPVPADDAHPKGATAPRDDAGSVNKTIARRANQMGRMRYIARLAVFAALLSVAGLCVALAWWLAPLSL